MSIILKATKENKEKAILEIKINIEKIILGLSKDSFLLFKNLSLGLLQEANRVSNHKKRDKSAVKIPENYDDHMFYLTLKNKTYDLFLLICTHRHGYLFNSETDSAKKIKEHINNLTYMHTDRIKYTYKTYQKYNDFVFYIKNNISEYNVLFHGSGDSEKNNILAILYFQK